MHHAEQANVMQTEAIGCPAKDDHPCELLHAAIRMHIAGSATLCRAETLFAKLEGSNMNCVWLDFSNSVSTFCGHEAQMTMLNIHHMYG